MEITNLNDISWDWTSFPWETYLSCICSALVLGLLISIVYCYKMKQTDSMRISIALLPAMVAGIILVINDNLAAGIAVLGAFTLIRFRSAPGSAKDISVILFVMTVGLMCGMKAIPFAIVFTLIVGALFVIYNRYYSTKGRVTKILHITVPEDLDYTVTFEDVISGHTESHELVGVKTTNMGSMYRLSYEVVVKSVEEEKKMIDAIRTRNGNLEVSVVNKTDKYTQL